MCTICNKINSGVSGYELELREYIKTLYDGRLVVNYKKLISPLEVDIYLPDINIAIEFNGLYWHNELKKENDYHYKKHQMCKNNGVELIQIYEDDWLYKNDIVKSILKNKVTNVSNRVYARSCSIELVSNKNAKIFLSENHLQGKINAKINIGLYIKDELISIMSFGRLRRSLGSKSNNDNYELLRYCNKLNTTVIGGASKLLNHFNNNYSFCELITYYDKSFGFKNVYEKIGFIYSGETKPNYYYIVSGIKRHRYNYSKYRLVKEGFDSNKTEKEIMLERKIYRIYNSGNYKYIYTKY